MSRAFTRLKTVYCTIFGNILVRVPDRENPNRGLPAKTETLASEVPLKERNHSGAPNTCMTRSEI